MYGRNACEWLSVCEEKFLTSGSDGSSTSSSGGGGASSSGNC